MEARIEVVLKLTHSLIHGWRIGGENTTVPFGDELSFIDQATYGILLLIQAYARCLLEDLQGSQEALIAIDARLAREIPRQPILGLAQADANEVEKGDVSATDEAIDAAMDPKMKSLRITNTRCTALRYTCERLLINDTHYNGPPHLDPEGLLPPESKWRLATAAHDLNEYFQKVVDPNKKSVREYDKYASSKGWVSLSHAATLGAALTRDADREMVGRCESWEVDQE